MNVKIIIFDLDDTLYPEIEYVYSGFRAVSRYFSKIVDIDEDILYKDFLFVLEKEGRGRVFDIVLKKYNIFTKQNINKAVTLYRTHIPNICLPKDSIETLEYFKNKNIPLYIITDGNKIVQAKKVQALKLEKYVKKAFITHRYGKKHSKPSTYCFEKIAKIEKENFENIVYIGDNINKDFINIKKLGFKTIRINQGMFLNAIKPLEFHAEIKIDNIKELEKILQVG